MCCKNANQQNIATSYALRYHNLPILHVFLLIWAPQQWISGRYIYIVTNRTKKSGQPRLTLWHWLWWHWQLAVASPSFPPQLWLVCLSSCCKLWQDPNMRSCWLGTPDQMKTKDVCAWLFHRKKAYRLINTTTYWLSLWDHGKRVLNV